MILKSLISDNDNGTHAQEHIPERDAISWDAYLWAISSVITRYAQVAKHHKAPR